ncbi:hypothetical protein JTE88_06725 [Arcanobacterium phocisimile]|uniref:Uncharacterized protein n=1 Tax=Arcanobacterium phocisimile TaxID=1302235 RepID=A0ABX7IF68_9ACTO|nr:hypothetical protein [Arcanobacterium phocisimile]QRV01781.1 hypothetical protein JTE88_06725 [Arcanobacterium phocisimile]
MSQTPTDSTNPPEFAPNSYPLSDIISVRPSLKTQQNAQAGRAMPT